MTCLFTVQAPDSTIGTDVSTLVASVAGALFICISSSSIGFILFPPLYWDEEKLDSSPFPMSFI